MSSLKRIRPVSTLIFRFCAGSFARGTGPGSTGKGAAASVHACHGVARVTLSVAPRFSGGLPVRTSFAGCAGSSPGGSPGAMARRSRDGRQRDMGLSHGEPQGGRRAGSETAANRRGGKSEFIRHVVQGESRFRPPSSPPIAGDSATRGVAPVLRPSVSRGFEPAGNRPAPGLLPELGSMARPPVLANDEGPPFPRSSGNRKCCAAYGEACRRRYEVHTRSS